MKWKSVTAVTAGLVLGANGLCTGKSNTPICAAASACDDVCDDPSLKCSDMAAAYGCDQVRTFGNCQKCTCTCPPGAPVPAPTAAKTGSCTGAMSCSSALAQWQKDSLIQIHNSFRSYHGACPLTYDDTIADYALTSSGFQQTCTTGTLKHNNPPQYSGGKLGENLAMSGGTKDVHNFDPADSVMNWYCDEEPCWSYASSSESDTTGHFTQVVWKESTKVGCGLCQIGTGSLMNVYLICNYEAAGNSANNQGPGSVYETNVGQPSSTASCANTPPTAVPTPAPGVPPTPAPAGTTPSPNSPPSTTPSPPGSTPAPATGVPGVPPTPSPNSPPGTTPVPGSSPGTTPVPGSSGSTPVPGSGGSAPTTPSPDDEGTPAWVWVAIICGVLLLIGCGVILYMVYLLHRVNQKSGPLLGDISNDLPHDEITKPDRREMQLRDTTVKI
eukprot:TRINITY_DN593_c2_g1_i1.p1 TRINITY_DN593_c2_g1~~TRINITY_DN593_c2_g1_i1.p1  ORF type:complete len:462 (+),score=89.31 TRINITY_DN593_c2_g1_i1:63-1388(+)